MRLGDVFFYVECVEYLFVMFWCPDFFEKAHLIRRVSNMFLMRMNGI